MGKDLGMGVGLMGHLLCIWILKIVLWYPCLQVCLKGLQFYLLQTDLLSSANEKNSSELAKGSRNLFFFLVNVNLKCYAPLIKKATKCCFLIFMILASSW